MRDEVQKAEVKHHKGKKVMSKRLCIEQKNNHTNLCNLWLRLNLRALRALRGSKYPIPIFNKINYHRANRQSCVQGELSHDFIAHCACTTRLRIIV